MISNIGFKNWIKTPVDTHAVNSMAKQWPFCIRERGNGGKAVAGTRLLRT